MASSVASEGDADASDMCKVKDDQTPTLRLRLRLRLRRRLRLRLRCRLRRRLEIMAKRIIASRVLILVFIASSMTLTPCGDPDLTP